jgi:hypothetical protein
VVSGIGIKRTFDPELTFYSDKAWYTLSGYVNSQNNRYWSTEILMLFMKCRCMI